MRTKTTHRRRPTRVRLGLTLLIAGLGVSSVAACGPRGDGSAERGAEGGHGASQSHTRASRTPEASPSRPDTGSTGAARSAPTTESTPEPSSTPEAASPDNPSTPESRSADTSSTASDRYSTTRARVAQAVNAGSGITESEFLSADGTVYCRIVADNGPAGCELVDGRHVPDEQTCPPQGAGPAGVGRVEWQATGPEGICNGDTMIAGTLPDRLAVGVATSVRGAPISCISETEGISCIDTSTRRGFSLSPSSWQTFSG